MLIINLYTSRIVLNILGIVDFGINNVVGGVITMLGFLTSSLGGASSRFITYNLGKENIKILKKTFGNILSIHVILIFIILIVGETIGLWFITTQLQIPEERSFAAFWVYQFSIFSSMMAVISVPYNSVIIAHEKMAIFAYISLLDAVLKLLIAYALLVIPFDKLIIYSFLFFCIQLFDCIIYIIYCIKHFDETKSKPMFEKNQFKEIFNFAVWTMNGNLAVIGMTQGINVLLNIFLGPAVNAARGIAVQVQNVCRQFCSNFQMALNPQITKSYAKGEVDNMHRLIIKSSKFSFYILFFIVLPLSLEAESVLKLWLGVIPEHTVSFLRLILIVGLLYTLSNPIIMSVHATGNLKKFQLIEGSILLTIVPIAYLLLKYFNIQPEVVFCVHIIVETIAQIIRLKIVLPMIKMKMSVYLSNVIKPIILVTILSIPIPILIYINIPQGLLSFFIVCLSCVTIVSTVIYKIGSTTNEKRFLKEKVSIIINKIK